MEDGDLKFCVFLGSFLMKKESPVKAKLKNLKYISAFSLSPHVTRCSEFSVKCYLQIVTYSDYPLEVTY